MGAGLDAIAWLGWVILFVSGFSVFVALLQGLSDRKKELAMLRIMGSSPLQLFSLILVEGLILAILGCIIGLIFSHVAIWAFSDYLRSIYNYNFNAIMFIPEELGLIIGSIAIGVLTAIYPSYKAYRTNMHQTIAEG